MEIWKDGSFYVDFSDDMKSACFCPLCQMHPPLCIERVHIPYSARWVEKGPQGHHVIYECHIRMVHQGKNIQKLPFPVYSHKSVPSLKITNAVQLWNVFKR